MEEALEAAMASYANMSNDQKELVVSMFNSIDVDGDGKVSNDEYLEFLKTKGGCQKEVPQNLFKLLDSDNDGTLIFEECVTFYYLLTCKRCLFCKGCEAYLSGLRFVCIKCFKANKEKSYELCSSCYGNKNFSHPHSSFLDSDALLHLQPRKRDKLKRGAKKVLKYGAEIGVEIGAEIAWFFVQDYLETESTTPTSGS